MKKKTIYIAVVVLCGLLIVLGIGGAYAKYVYTHSEEFIVAAYARIHELAIDEHNYTKLTSGLVRTDLDPDAERTYGYNEETKELKIPEVFWDDDDCVWYKVVKITGADTTNHINSAFSGCTAEVTSVSLPKTVTSIGTDAFDNFTELESITVDEGNPSYFTQDGILYNSAKTSILKVSPYIAGEIAVPDGVTEIGWRAFYGCSRITKITLPETVSKMGNQAFGECTSLAAINIPQKITTITDGAFKSCSSLKSITLHDNIKTLKVGSFRYCGLESIVIPASVTSLQDEVFDGNESLTSITLLAKIDSSGARVFRGCTSLVTVDIPGTFVMGIQMFQSCSALTTVTLGEGITTIPYRAFEGCSALTNINFPSTLTTIGASAFTRSGFLKGTISIPEHITQIGDNAFSGLNGVDEFDLILYNREVSGAPWGSKALAVVNRLDGVTISYVSGQKGANGSDYKLALSGSNLPEQIALTNDSGAKLTVNVTDGQITIPHDYCDASNYVVIKVYTAPSGDNTDSQLPEGVELLSNYVDDVTFENLQPEDEQPQAVAFGESFLSNNQDNFPDYWEAMQVYIEGMAAVIDIYDDVFSDLIDENGGSVTLKDVIELDTDPTVYQAFGLKFYGCYEGCGDATIQFRLPTPYKAGDPICMIFSRYEIGDDDTYTFTEHRVLAADVLESEEIEVQTYGKVQVVIPEEIVMDIQDNIIIVSIVSNNLDQSVVE